MTKSPHGTEYVNAQVSELKVVIDKYAEEIANSLPETGLVYFHTFYDPSGKGMFCVWIVGNGVDQEGKHSFTLGVHGGVNNGSGFSRTVRLKVKPVVLPAQIVTIQRDLEWDNYYFPEGHGSITVTLSTSGHLSINVVNPHGRMPRSEHNYTHEQ